MAATVVLMVASGSLKGRQFEYSKPTAVTVGRACDCSLQLPSGDINSAVSRHHCRFEIDPPEIRLRDLGSLNGTYLNGVKIGGRQEGPPTERRTEHPDQAVCLQDGDVIRIGNTLLCVVLADVELRA